MRGTARATGKPGAITAGDLPPTNVIKSGLSGEFIRRLLDSGRYDRAVAKRPGLDYVFIRCGGNDFKKRENFEVNFPKDYHELLAGLRRDHPAAVLFPTTNIPWGTDLEDETAKFLAPIMREKLRRQ